jgi:hypothetical protein
MKDTFLKKHRIENFDLHVLIQSMVATIGLKKTKSCFAHYVEIVAAVDYFEKIYEMDKS